MNILITGASGFVGSALINKLKHANITAISRSEQLSHENVHWEKFSLERLITSVLLSTKQFDTVVHLAAKAHALKEPVSLEEYRVVNCEQTIALAEKLADKGMKRFVFISSIGVNGSHTNTGDPYSEDSLPSPHSDYAISKYEAEIQLKALSEAKGFELVIIRPPLIYGKKAPGNFNSLYKIIKKGFPLPFGLIKNKRSFISIDNFCDFIDIAINHPQAANKLFLVADDESISTNKLVTDIWAAEKIKSFTLPIPVFLLRGVFYLLGKSNFSTQLLDNLEVDNSNAKIILGWKPKDTLYKHFDQL